VSNPTGTVYLQANPSYAWTDGDVYEIVQTDEVEGASTGAAFAGLGVDNQPHQVLLNKINYIHGKQLIDEANITALQGLTQLITSDVGLNGWLKLGAEDVNLGQIQLIIQWGTISLLGFAGSSVPTIITFSFPIAYPNAIWMLVPYYETNSTAAISIQIDIAIVSPLQKQGNQIAHSLKTSDIASGSTPGITGIGWVALGY
jgi:hypothetical protein